MKKNIQLLLLILTFSTYAQTPLANELVQIHTVDNLTELTITTPIEGSLVYNKADKSIYQRTDSEWINLNKERKSYVGHFIINSTGQKTISALTFKPSNITFQAYANIEAENINDDNDSGNNNSNTLANSFHSMTRYARDDNGTINQQVIGVGGNGNSINDISRYSNPNQCIGIRYGNQDGTNLGITSAALTAFNSDGFTINVNSKADNLLVIYTAYE